MRTDSSGSLHQLNTSDNQITDSAELASFLATFSQVWSTTVAATDALLEVPAANPPGATVAATDTLLGGPGGQSTWQ